MLLESFLVRSDHLHCRRKDPLATSVIHIQCHRLCLWIILCEIQHDLRSCSTEMIDGLIIIPHDKQIILRLRKKLHDVILKLVDILKLIDQDILKFILPRRQNILPLIKKVITVEDHVIKIQFPSRLTGFDIFPVDLTENLIRTARRIIIFQRDPVSLDNTDLLGNFFRKITFLCQFPAMVQCKFPENCRLLLL